MGRRRDKRDSAEVSALLDCRVDAPQLSSLKIVTAAQVVTDGSKELLLA